MKLLINTYTNIKNKEPITLAIGNFDGVHTGHQSIIKRVKSYTDTKSAVLTFYPHPLRVLRDVEFQEIQNLSQKIAYLEETGIDYLFIPTFEEAFYTLSVEDFIAFLKGLSVKRVVVGRDFRFAYHAKGSIHDLKKHFLVDVIDDFKKDSIRISSTYIRDLIYSSNLDEAKRLLGRSYQIIGKVIHGSHVGHSLGFPTANLDYDSYVLPKNGVYFVAVTYKGKVYKGALNIGYNPTLNYSYKKRVEVHLLDFSGNLYGEDLSITFIKHLRPEYKFTSKEALIQQLNMDIEEIKNLKMDSLF